jgi:putative polyhydroxyalkanoate system protein
LLPIFLSGHGRLGAAAPPSRLARVAEASYGARRMTFDFPHTLTRDDARARMEALTEYLTRRHGLQVTWDGDRGTVRGKVLAVVTIDGAFVVSDDSVHVEGKDPGMLWRKRAVEYLKKKFDQYLDPACPLAELPRAP